ncbi:hypothetical protein B0H34DRAFT_809463 [Crassisporium funariophilum]|nr:hypothetical protein B0H34DRAFT_809463 [Crassisporium funariophilum]
MSNTLARYFFKAPEGIDLDALAKSTSLALALLVPWCKSDNQSYNALRPISEQARAYVRAIDCSVVAAQQGYNVAEDAVTLCKSIRAQTSQQELDAYAKSMVELAKNGHSKAKEALDQFRTVRKDILALVSKAERVDDSDTGSFKIYPVLSKQNQYFLYSGQLQQLEEGIPVLEALEKNISDYITWWNWMECTTNGQVKRTKPLEVNYGSLRDQAVMKKWKELRKSFVLYSTKINRLQDKYPKMFAAIRIKPQDVEGDSEAVFDADQVPNDTSQRYTTPEHIQELRNRQKKSGVWQNIISRVSFLRDGKA